jgi:TatD DNase family protein
MLIDAHVHLDKYGNLLEKALEQIEGEQIFTVATAMDLPSYEQLRSIASRSELVVPTFGVHPKRAPEYAGRLRELNGAIEQSPALGEIGLDFHWVKDSSTFPAQLKVLEYFLAAAREQKKIVNLHTKGAEKQILDLLEDYDITRAIIHWYSGPLDLLRAFSDFGAYFTIGVEVLFSEHIRRIARELPMHCLLTETDNPGGLQWLNGTPGMPADIKKVVAILAQLRNSSVDAVVETVQGNFLRLLDADSWLQQVRNLFIA